MVFPNDQKVDFNVNAPILIIDPPNLRLGLPQHN